MSIAEVPEGMMRDSQARLVAIENIRPEHLLEDEMVRKLVTRAAALSTELGSFKANALSESKGFIDLLAQQFGAQRGGARGNVTFTSYDGQTRVQIAIGDTMSFGPELQVAKSLIDECLRSWTDDARPELRTLIDDAFQVGKEGKLQIDRILSLRRIDIADPRWKRAMTAISSALKVIQSKEYIRFYARPTPNAEFVQVPLDLARV